VKTIAIGNLKGGTGKTSTAGNLAYALREFGPVLLVDADPQGNLSGWLSEEPTDAVRDALEGKPLNVVKLRENLDLLTTLDLASELREWSDYRLNKEEFAIFDFLDAADAAGYRYCIVDLHPEATATLERRFLSAADEVITVMAAETFSVNGLDNFLGALKTIQRQSRRDFKTDRVVLNRVNRSYSIHNAYLEQLESKGLTLYTIGQAQAIANAQLFGLFLAEHDEESKQIAEYKRLAEEVA